ncbi:hypothetical protein [Agromyces sp. Leaf222]|uniref:hypothetical protein n=1 Tax=Agromyces sp. Leaf222 TaxID=1735688 RepID=UPI000AF5AFEE|nr:hypothetical protein [Agromyces sp. Leaf222]
MPLEHADPTNAAAPAATAARADAAHEPPPATGPHGLARRGFLTLAVAGAAASAFTVTIGTLAPSPAHAEGTAGAAGEPIAPRKRELRAMWISSVVNID